jgi:hypothetical protein
MATYKVELSDHSHYVTGLAPDWEEGKVSRGVLLIYHYPEGDCDTRMMNTKMMLSALYDLFQTHDGLKDGDIFDTEFGNFICKGVHVVPA